MYTKWSKELFSQRLWEAIENSHVSQATLSSDLDISADTLAHYLDPSNSAEPDIGNLVKFSLYFNTTLDYLLGRTDKQSLLTYPAIFPVFRELIDQGFLSTDALQDFYYTPPYPEMPENILYITNGELNHLLFQYEILRQSLGESNNDLLQTWVSRQTASSYPERDTLKASFANHLQKVMKEKNISQVQLSKDSDITQPTISSYIRQKRQVTLVNLDSIACAMNSSIDELLGIPYNFDCPHTVQQLFSKLYPLLKNDSIQCGDLRSSNRSWPKKAVYLNDPILISVCRKYLTTRKDLGNYTESVSLDKFFSALTSNLDFDIMDQKECFYFQSINDDFEKWESLGIQLEDDFSTTCHKIIAEIHRCIDAGKEIDPDQSPEDETVFMHSGPGQDVIKKAHSASQEMTNDSATA